jgi:hypothetical protein
VLGVGHGLLPPAPAEPLTRRCSPRRSVDTSPRPGWRLADRAVIDRASAARARLLLDVATLAEIGAERGERAFIGVRDSW